jgi:N-acetylglucosamine kinase
MWTVFDIGGSRIRAGLARAPGRVEPLGAWPTPTDDYAAFVAVLRNAVAQGSVGAALSIAGVVDPETGVITSANIPCLDGRNLAADLTRDLGLAVISGNDADCFALAEARSGAGAGQRVVFGVILGTGVGGGVVIDGAIHQGAGGFSGEWGHGPLVQLLAPALAGWQCGCGLTGCMDTVGGARGMERLYRQFFGTERECAAILVAWQEGDAAASQVVLQWLEMVSAALAVIVNVVGPSVVPVGGGLANSAELIAALDERVRAQILQRRPEPLLVRAHHRVEPGMIGASWLGWANG